MGTTKASKRPKLRWDQHKREVLCCLHRFFVRDKKQFEEIFSYLFRDHLQNRGIQGFVPFSTLNTQWCFMRNERDPVWCHVHIDTSFETGAEWKEIIETIKSAADILQLPLREVENEIDTTRERSLGADSGKSPVPTVPATTILPVASPSINPDIYQQRLDKDCQEDDDWVVTSHGKTCFWCGHDGLTTGHSGLLQEHQSREYYESEDESHGGDGGNSTLHNSSVMEGPSGMEGFSPRIPRPYHTEGSVVVHTVAPGIVTKSDLQQKLDDHQDDHQDNHEDDSGLRGVLPENLPASLYRWYDSNSQGYNSENAFLAGVFCRSAFFDRDEISDDQFRAYFRSHVTKERSTTPFISSFRSPLAPIHRAVHSPEDGKVAIIDSAKLNTKVFYAHPLAKHTDTFTYSWRGYGEFLIWGRIPKDAIIFTLRASQLDQIAHVHKDISRLLQLSLIRKSFRCNQVLRDRLEERRKSAYKSGRTLGKLLSLLQFPRIHWENFARWFAKSWGWCYTEEFVQFMSGLRSELPYLNQELSDSESEEYLVSPQMTPQKLRRGRDPHSPAESDLDYEPPASEEDSDWCSVDQPAATLGTQSVSMDNRSDTVDDGRFSTHETLSSFGLPERVGSGFHGQKKSNLSTTRDKYEVCDEVNDQLVHPEWPSDNETRPTPASPFAVVIIRRADGNIRQ